ncbi:hypothetical protein EJD97_013825 [Solanum chilense]|uniref:Uncharacterized protein n=1 Tax=Solanum chilense TaxID=4083 RepID=A0A6N2BFN8_SOLCI|nr:hypothetical protein EJD97_013825 [Solanum chilense]
MSYYPKGHHHNDDVPEFDEYDETPYGGGYDIKVTYGNPIPPSEETCYPLSSESDDFDHDRPHYASSAEPSAYGDEALDNEYQNYSKPKTRPSRSRHEDGDEDENPRRKPGMNRPSGGGYGGESEYNEQSSEYNEPSSDYRSGYGRKNDDDEYGSRQRRKSEDEEENTDYGSGYGRRQTDSEYGSGYGRNNEHEENSGYGRKTDSDEYGSGYGRNNEYEENSGYGRKTDTDEYGSGYRKKNSEYEEERQEYGSSGYGKTTNYGEEEDSGYGGKSTSYGRSNYETTEGEGYGTSFERPSYGRSEEEDYRKPSYGRRDDDDEGYGRKKYGDDESDEDEDKKQRHRSHQRRQNYDD